MSEVRDFKGVWIPRDIWLNNDLSMIEKGILTEISSLDNENHCIASNEYFAEFCQCSVATVTRAIKHLMELNYIEQVSFDGRHRIIKMSIQTNQNDEADYSKCNANNTNNNIGINRNNTKVLLEVEKTEKPKKKNLYNKCSDYIVQYTNNIPLQDALHRFLELRLEIAKNEGKPFYYNMWPSIVNDLDKYDTDMAIKVVEQSIQKGWKRFYEIKDYSQKSSIKSADYEKNVISDKHKELDLTGEVY